MKRPRIIPVLLLHKGGLVKSINFKNHVYIGDPINAVRIFNDLGVDEIVLLDIDASKEKRSISIDLVKEIGEEANMPFSVGGGIGDIETMREIIQAGAEKIILNTNALPNPHFIRDASDAFGSSTISVCVDYKKRLLGKNLVHIKGGTERMNISPLEAAKLAEDAGAGEVILQSIDRDGTMSGFDLPTIETVSRSLAIPVVALGGAGSIADFENLFRRTYVNGISAGSFFVFQGKHRGVLIRYPPIKDYNFE